MSTIVRRFVPALMGLPTASCGQVDRADRAAISRRLAGEGDTRGAGVGYHARAAGEDDLREGGREHDQGYGRDREPPAGQG